MLQDAFRNDVGRGFVDVVHIAPHFVSVTICNVPVTGRVARLWKRPCRYPQYPHHDCYCHQVLIPSSRHYTSMYSWSLDCSAYLSWRQPTSTRNFQNKASQVSKPGRTKPNTMIPGRWTSPIFLVNPQRRTSALAFKLKCRTTYSMSEMLSYS